MSEPLTALAGQSHSGAIRIEDAGPVGMVTIRGDIDAIAERLTEAVGTVMPGRRGSTTNGDRTLLWMSPDELLLVLPYGQAGEAVARVGEVLADSHHLVADVSDARAVIDLSGPGGAIRDTLAKLTPADLSPTALATGEVRRTRLSQVAAAIWFTGDDSARVVCFRSVAPYVFRLLCVAATPGAEPGYHAYP